MSDAIAGSTASMRPSPYLAVSCMTANPQASDVQWESAFECLQHQWSFLM